MKKRKGHPIFLAGMKVLYLNSWEDGPLTPGCVYTIQSDDGEGRVTLEEVWGIWYAHKFKSLTKQVWVR